MRIIDTHCHLDDDKLYPTAKDVVERAKKAGVVYLFNTADSLPSFERVLKLAEDFPDVCYSVLGIHPEFATEEDDYFLSAYKEREKQKEKIKAIGEIGLDYHYSKDEEIVAKQKQRFIEQIRLAKKWNLPIVIHSRDADYDTFKIIQEEKPDRIDLHCYSGSSELLDEYLRLPIRRHIGIGGVSTFKNAKTIQRVIKEHDISLFLSETDSPYLAPTPHRGEVNEPCYLPLIIKEIARLKEENEEEVAEKIYQNGVKFYGRE